MLDFSLIEIISIVIYLFQVIKEILANPKANHNKIWLEDKKLGVRVQEIFIRIKINILNNLNGIFERNGSRVREKKTNYFSVW